MNKKEFEEQKLKEFLMEVETPLRIIKATIQGQVNYCLRKYKEEYELDFSDDVIDEILKVLEV